jgi:hypothetical protein
MRAVVIPGLAVVLASAPAHAADACPTCTGDFGSLALVLFGVLGAFFVGSRVSRWVRSFRARKQLSRKSTEVIR